MKFLIAKEDLLEVIGKLQSIVPPRPALPLLANFLIEAQNDELVFTATDLTVGIRCFCMAKVIEPGSTTLPARRFFQLIREITAPQIEISSGVNEVTEVVAGTSKFRIHGMSKKEFPSLPDFAGASTLKMTQAQLRQLFFRTSFAVSKEDTRYTLTGVLMEVENTHVTFVGTDGKRLAKANFKPTQTSLTRGRYILPIKAVEEISKILKDNDEEVTVSCLPDKISIEANHNLLITKLLSGEYPDYQRVIPKKSDIEIIVHREELMTLLRQVSLFTGEQNQSVRFSLTSGELVISANSSEIGEGRVSMPIHYQGEKFEIAFNPVFFLDILRHSSEETLKVELTDPFNPGIIRDNEDAFYVLMPMRFSEAS